MDLVAAGHIVCETIRFPDRTVGPVLGSPPAYSLVAAARLGTSCGLVTKVGADFPRELLVPFEQAGVDMKGIGRCPRSTTSELIYDAAGNKEIRFPTRAEPITAGDFPGEYHSCGMVYVCTMQDDVPLEQLGRVAAMGHESAIDLGGYGGAHMSRTRRQEISDMAAFALEAAGQFDFVKASDEDCRVIFGGGSPKQYAERILDAGPRVALITLGASGVVVGTGGGIWHVPALKGKPVDPTGGGDTFMGGFLSAYLRTGDVMESAVFGAATALCVIERTGGVTAARMPTREEVLARIPADARESVVPA
jgi:sugar/nucleoside kinase (ribokinase family)